MNKPTLTEIRALLRIKDKEKAEKVLRDKYPDLPANYWRGLLGR
jgi:hypothetical protein